MEHTPGPWKAAESSTMGAAIVGNLEDERVIAEIVWNYEEVGWTDEDEANARLIAAAPELLEALRQICLPFREYLENNPEPECIEP